MRARGVGECRPARAVCLASRGLIALFVASVSLAVGAQQVNKGQFYVLDAFGGVHAGSGAPAISPATPYFGFDVAQDLTYIPQGSIAGHGDGILVLDAFGGVHVGGALTLDPPTVDTPYFGFDVARAIVSRAIPPRANGQSLNNPVTLGSTFASYVGAFMDVPFNGWLIVTASAQFECLNAVSGTTAVVFGLALNGVAPANSYVQVIDDCTAPGLEVASITHMFPVTAGRQGVGLVLAKRGGGIDPVVTSRDITILYVNQNSIGAS